MSIEREFLIKELGFWEVSVLSKDGSSRLEKYFKIFPPHNYTMEIFVDEELTSLFILITEDEVDYAHPFLTMPTQEELKQFIEAYAASF